MSVVVIEQPNYVPWVGYFDLVDRSDIFVIYDDVQYTIRDWRNRNMLKTPQGLKWITVPVYDKGRMNMRVNEVNIKYTVNWYEQHLKLFYHMYHKCPFFDDAYGILEKELMKKPEKLSDLDISLIRSVSDYLGIKTKFDLSSNYPSNKKKLDRILELCEIENTTEYLSGPKAANYINPEEFEKRKIKLEYINYSYGVYDQPYGDFTPYVSILDTIACLGKETINYIRKEGKWRM